MPLACANACAGHNTASATATISPRIVVRIVTPNLRAGSKIRFGSPGVKRRGAILARVRERTSKIMKRLVQVAIVVIACVPVGTRALAPEQSRGDVHVTFARDVAPILYRACA